MPSGFPTSKECQIIWLSNLSSLSVGWCMLFQKRVVRTNLDILKFILIIIDEILLF